MVKTAIPLPIVARTALSERSAGKMRQTHLRPLVGMTFMLMIRATSALPIVFCRKLPANPNPVLKEFSIITVSRFPSAFG